MFAHFNQGDLDRAIVACTGAVRLDRALAMAYNHQGCCYASGGEHKQARDQG